jgi:ATP-binding cassette subfamily C protein CydD
MRPPSPPAGREASLVLRYNQLLRLLSRFTELASGAVYAGRADLAAVPVDRWRAQIAWVPQHPRLFGGSVADNIALGQPGACRGAIEDAARLAGAALFIEALPRGYDTLLGERAAELLAGQRQQLALARAFLRDAPLLLLDEPTAHLDPDSRRALTADLLRATEGRAVLLITHERDGLDQVDQIVVLDHGRVAEQGSHHQLRHAGGPYQRMRESDYVPCARQGMHGDGRAGCL